MTTPINASFDEDELSGLLRHAVEQARQQQPPLSFKEQALSCVAADLATNKSAKAAPQRRSQILFAFTAIAAVLLVAVILVLQHKLNQVPMHHVSIPFRFTPTSQNFGTNP